MKRHMFGAIAASAVAVVIVVVATTRPPPAGGAEADGAEVGQTEAGGAGAGPAKGPPPAQLVIRFYDVSDLLRDPVEASPAWSVVPPTEANYSRWGPWSGGGSGGGGGTGLFGSTAGNARDERPTDALTAGTLSSLVRWGVDPNSWTDAGGTAGSIEPIGTRLAIRQTPGAHKQVDALLADFRKARGLGQAMEVEAHWLLLQPDQLKAVLSADKAAAVGEVDLAAVGKLGKSAAHATARARCVGGNTVGLLSGRSRNVVVDANVTVDGPNDIEPTMAQVLSGARLFVRPYVQADAALVDVEATVSDWDGPGGPGGTAIAAAATRPTTRPIPPGGARGGLSENLIGGDPTRPIVIDRLDSTVQALRTTARLPLNRPVVVGGMTYEPARAGGDPRQLYLVLRVTAR